MDEQLQLQPEVVTELEASSVLTELARLAQEHRLLISISLSPADGWEDK